MSDGQSWNRTWRAYAVHGSKQDKQGAKLRPVVISDRARISFFDCDNLFQGIARKR
jgi:hypothetical protein